MKLMKKLIIIFLFFASISYADEGNRFFTGSELLPYCQAEVRVINAPNSATNLDVSQGNICGAYIEGVIDSLSDTLELNDKKVASSWEGALLGVSPGQLSMMLVDYMLNNPKDLNKSASFIILAMLLQQYNIKTN